MIKLVSFRLMGRLGHFLRAESGTSALSYPVPPKTVILGIVGAVLGLDKDEPQLVLEPMQAAVAGRCPVTHWHKAKLRKDPPELLPGMVRKTQALEKGTKPERTALLNQEWLVNPDYRVWVNLPEPYQSEFEQRIRERSWHFQPCLGLSEMMADLEYMESIEAEKLPEDSYEVSSVINQGQAQLDITSLYDRLLAVQLIRMPKAVTADRVFTHASYLMEKEGHPMPVLTAYAYRAGNEVVMFL